MPGLMIIAHAPLASALKVVAEHTFPDCARTLEVLDVARDMPVEEVEALARAMLERVRTPEALIFTDVFGATPCNVAQRLGDGYIPSSFCRQAEVRLTSTAPRFTKARA